MSLAQLELRTLRPEDETSFREAVASFKDEKPAFGFAFDYTESESFPDYIEKLEAWSRGEDLPGNFVPNTFFVGVVDGVIVGRLSLRHELNSFLKRVGGHIGYGVVPKYRKQGYATEMLKQALPICSSLGISNVLVTCDVDNLASAKTIERCGGRFEGESNDPNLEVQVRRYWISI